MLIIIVAIILVVLLLAGVVVVGRRRQHKKASASASAGDVPARTKARAAQTPRKEGGGMVVNAAYAPAWMADGAAKTMYGTAASAQAPASTAVTLDAANYVDSDSSQSRNAAATAPPPDLYVEPTPLVDAGLYEDVDRAGTGGRAPAAAAGVVGGAPAQCGYASSAGRQCKKMSPQAYCPVHMCTICRNASKSSKSKSCDGCAASAAAPHQQPQYAASTLPSYEEPVTSNPTYYEVADSTPAGVYC
jgi:hypothetical protein